MPMTGRIVTALSLIALLPALAACGSNNTSASSETVTTATTSTTSTVPEDTTTIRLYFLLDGKVQPVWRTVPKTQAVARAALDELLTGPSTANRELGMTTAMPNAVEGWTVSLGGDGVLKLDAKGLSRAALAQTVYTLTQFPTVKAVELDGKRYTRANFEDETPIILVESPLPFTAVSSPIHATGTANTFEATFQYEVVGPDGKVLATHFVTATSGSGTRGTFDFTTKPFSATGDGALVVFEYSAKDGSRIHEVRIPLHFES
jgi:germination protein M